MRTKHRWLGSRHQRNKNLPQTLTLRNGTVLQFSTAGSNLTMADHIAAVCRSSFFYLRQLRCIRQSSTPAATKTLVNAFVSSRLDYCNQLFVGIRGRLQSIQNASARLVTEARKSDRITPVIRELHWLPVRLRREFKTAFLVFKSLRGLVPVYLIDYCKLTCVKNCQYR